MFKFNHAMLRSMLLVGVGLCLPACGTNKGTGTDSDAEEAPPPGSYCANPQFAVTEGAPDGEGELYVCQGQVEGEFRFMKCILSCPEQPGDTDAYDEEVPVDGGTGDGIIPFPPEDPTGGPVEGADVKTCCEPGIENAGLPGSVEGAEACASACGYAACSEALARFQALRADESTWDECPNQTCITNVQNSLDHFIAYLTDNFASCVNTTLDPNSGTVFKMTNPGCADGSPVIGCLVWPVLDMSCNSVTINFDSNTGVCTESPEQPPVPTSQACAIGVGGGQVTDGSGIEYADFTSGSAVTRYFDCGDDLCPFVLDGFEVSIEDVEGGGVELSNLAAELIIAAYGQSDGDYMEFAPGALRVRVTGTWTDGAGSSPFEAMGSNSEVAAGSHHWDLLSMSATFEAGGYTFSAYIEEAECSNL